MATRQQRLVAEQIRRRRQELGWTQAQLAARVGVHAQSIGNLERALHATDPETLRKVQQALNMADFSEGRLAALQAAEVIRDTVITKIEEMEAAQALMYVGRVLAYVDSDRWRDE